MFITEPILHLCPLSVARRTTALHANRMRCVGHAVHTEQMVKARKISVGNQQGKSHWQDGSTDVRIVLKLTLEQEVLGRTKAYFPLIQRQRRKRRVQQFLYCCVCIRCRGNVFTYPLSSNDRRIHYRHTDWWEVFIKYTVEMGSGVMIYIRSFIKIGSGIQKIIGRDTHTSW
jgi:hypothetical protein